MIAVESIAAESPGKTFEAQALEPQIPEVQVVTERGNTPLRTIPDDYVTDGEARWLLLGEGPDAGKRLFFYDEIFAAEKGVEPEVTLLFVHGNPESSYTYRQTIECVRRSTI